MSSDLRQRLQGTGFAVARQSSSASECHQEAHMPSEALADALGLKQSVIAIKDFKRVLLYKKGQILGFQEFSVVDAHHRIDEIHRAISREMQSHLFMYFTPERADLLRDRDISYGEPFPVTAHSLAIQEVLTAPHSPWQNPYCERLIGSIRRECLDHFIVLHERGLHRTKSYFEYYEQSRTHLSLDKDAPLTRAIQPPAMGRVIELPQVGGLHHRYERRAA
jgi:transposase InsO family protein